jgi:hypothetical protein
MALKIVADSHVDHGITKEQMAHVVETFSDKEEFFIANVILPEELGTVPCGLYGPVEGDAPVPEAEVEYVIRGKRNCASRVVNMPTRPTRLLTVIGGPDGDEKCVLYTAFGGHLAPKEPGDLTLALDKVQESRDFWAQHALSK